MLAGAEDEGLGAAQSIQINKSGEGERVTSPVSIYDGKPDTHCRA